MKKNLFFYAAAAALMLTACTNEDDVVQVEQTVTTAENDGGLGFDVYLPQATATRAGRANVMTTNTLKMTGFGVFGYQSDGTNSEGKYSTGDRPNYMWNQQVNYNSASNGWYYAPLKYWPNETKNDSQTEQAKMPDISPVTAPATKSLDRLTFFAYAPWVYAVGSTGAATRLNDDIEAPAGEGICSMTKNTGMFGLTGPTDPKIEYRVNTTNPNKAVDLLWGVAPVGNLSYTAVNNTETKVNEGFPLIDLTKPAVNTNIKFLFQHALARLGFKVVLASDQVAAGGNFDFGSTKVTIEEIDIEGEFGVYGYLNLNNTAKNVANWETVTAAKGSTNKLVIKDEALAEHLRYDATLNTSTPSQQTHTGVTTEYADVLQVSSVKDTRYNMYSVEEDAPAYSATRPYFANATNNAVPKTTDPVESATYMAYNDWTANPVKTYFYKTVMNSGKIAYTVIEPSVTYPYATFWKNIYATNTANIYQVVSGTPSAGEIKISTLPDSYVNITYRKVGNTYVPTGQKAELGDYIIASSIDEISAPQLTAGAKRWKALPNYFMVIPTNYKASQTKADRTIKVKIKYWVSTKDESLEKGIIYTKNEVEKEIELPSFDNGKAYNIKMILGMTSVKFEAEVADWTTTDAEINLPQNTAE